MNKRAKYVLAGRWACAVLVMCLAGCQQSQGMRVPVRPNRNSSDPFLGSPASRIPPTWIPPATSETATASNRMTSDTSEIRSVAGQMETRHPQTGTGDSVRPVVWNVPEQTDGSWEKVFRDLRAKGVTWQKLEMEGGQWRFQCSVADPLNPRQVREYYATATDPLKAVQAVLHKIDSQQQSLP